MSNHDKGSVVIAWSDCPWCSHADVASAMISLANDTVKILSVSANGKTRKVVIFVDVNVSCDHDFVEHMETEVNNVRN